MKPPTCTHCPHCQHNDVFKFRSNDFGDYYQCTKCKEEFVCRINDLSYCYIITGKINHVEEMFESGITGDSRISLHTIDNKTVFNSNI